MQNGTEPPEKEKVKSLGSFGTARKMGREKHWMEADNRIHYLDFQEHYFKVIDSVAILAELGEYGCRNLIIY